MLLFWCVGICSSETWIWRELHLLGMSEGALSGLHYRELSQERETMNFRQKQPLSAGCLLLNWRGPHVSPQSTSGLTGSDKGFPWHPLLWDTWPPTAQEGCMWPSSLSGHVGEGWYCVALSPWAQQTFLCLAFLLCWSQARLGLTGTIQQPMQKSTLKDLEPQQVTEVGSLPGKKELLDGSRMKIDISNCLLGK